MTTKRDEIIQLAEEVVADFELKRISYQNILFKCLRLCRLIDDEKGTKLFKYETSGYDHIDENTVSNEAWEISRLAKRHYFITKDGKKREYMFSDLIGDLENNNHSLEVLIKSSNDPNISISSANPNQHVFAPISNRMQRNEACKNMIRNANRISTVVGALYDYILNVRNAIVYGEYVENTFEAYKKDVDNKLASRCPEAIKRLNSAYDNLQSNNEQNWNNAIHASRRLLEDLADSLYPPKEPIMENGKKIELGKEQYKNRLLQYIKENKKSRSFYNVLSSSLDKIWDELTSIYDLTNKGSHADLRKDDAQRYLIHVYMLVSDILSL